MSNIIQASTSSQVFIGAIISQIATAVGRDLLVRNHRRRDLLGK